MSDLFLPHDIQIREISSYGLPSHAVDIVSSAAGLETRTLISDQRSKGYIVAVVDNEPPSNEALEEFHQAARTTHLSFTIPDTHNLWDLLERHTKAKFLSHWRFDDQLTFNAEGSRNCLYLASIRLVNVKI